MEQFEVDDSSLTVNINKKSQKMKKREKDFSQFDCYRMFNLL